MLEIAVPFA